jgi:hypothetical protein
MNQIRQSFCIAGVLLTTLGALYGQSAAQAAPGTPRTVNLESFDWDVPTLPVRVRIGSEVTNLPPFRLAIKGTDDDHWLERVQLTLRNVTNRTIVGAWMRVDFPDTEGPNRLKIMHDFTVSEVPERSQFDRRGVKHNVNQHPPLSVGPKSTFAIALGPEYEQMKQKIEAQSSISDIKSVWIRIVLVYFSDDSRWNGVYEIPDPGNPAGFLRGSAADFRLGLKRP